MTDPGEKLEGRHPAFTYPRDPEADWIDKGPPDSIVPGDIVGVPAQDPQGTTSPARYARGTMGAVQASLVETLEGDRDNWRRIAMQKDRQLIKLLNQVAELQAELRKALGAIEAEGRDHDRS
jgi:hypothetical protein